MFMCLIIFRSTEKIQTEPMTVVVLFRENLKDCDSRTLPVSSGRRKSLTNDKILILNNGN